MTPKAFDKITKEFVKATKEFLQTPSTYFTHMPDGVRVGFIETEKGISIELWHDKTLEHPR
jgi:hypothetical protein